MSTQLSYDRTKAAKITESWLRELLDPLGHGIYTDEYYLDLASDLIGNLDLAFTATNVAVPRELADMLDEAAGKKHSQEGQVMTTLARLLARYDELKGPATTQPVDRRQPQTGTGGHEPE